MIQAHHSPHHSHDHRDGEDDRVSEEIAVAEDEPLTDVESTLLNAQSGLLDQSYSYPLIPGTTLRSSIDGRLSREVSVRSSQRKPSDNTSLKERQPNRKIHEGFHILRSWWLELFTAALSLGCLGLNIGVLARIDGQPYQRWHAVSIEITPNTIISAVSTASKYSFLLVVAQGIGQLKWTYFSRAARQVYDVQVFDDATRGPLGSLQFLRNLRFQALVASGGAILTVLSIATEPFTQQILSYPSVLSNVTNFFPTIGATRVLDNGYYTLEAGAGLSKAVQQYEYRSPLMKAKGSYQLPFEIDTALQMGLLGSPTQTSYFCSYGTCNWPSFDSLGICSACENVTDQATTLCDMNHYPYYCRYSLPGGMDFWSAWIFLNLSSSTFSVMQNGSPSVPENRSQAALYPTTQFNLSMRRTNDATVAGSSRSSSFPLDTLGHIGNFSSFRLETEYPGGIGIETIKPMIYQCSISWCVKTYETPQFTNGVLQDQPSAMAPLRVEMQSCGSPYGNGSLVNTEGALCPAYKAGHLMPPSQALNSSLWPKADDVYWLNTANAGYVQAALQEAFQGVKIAGEVWQNWSQTYLPQPYKDALTNYRALNSNDTSFQAVYFANNGDVTETMAVVTTSLTNLLRQSPNSTGIIGSALYPITFVSVNWFWLLYPGALSVLAALFLITCIIISSRHGQVCWKSSSLALLFHGLDGWGPEELDKPDEESMERQALKMWAQLQRDDEGRMRLKRS